MTARHQTLNQRVTVDTFDRILTSCMDMGHDNGVGIVETGAEIVEQVAQPRITVWLDDCDDTALGSTAGCLQDSGNLDRVMGVIVVNRDAVPGAGQPTTWLRSTVNCR